jgi:uncharacterized membrane protein YeiB
MAASLIALMPSTGPVAPVERVELLDRLRGFALLGILTMNLLAFSGYYELSMVGDAAVR